MSEEIRQTVTEIEATIAVLDAKIQELREEKRKWAALLEAANARQAAADKLAKMTDAERAQLKELLA